MLRLVADATCPNGKASPLDPFCGFLDDHTHSPLLLELVSRVLWPLFVLTLFLVGSRLLRAIVRRALQRAGADAQLRTLVNNATVFGGYAVAIGGALVAAGLDLNIFLTVGGLGTLTLGLAFQDLLRNVVAGAFLLIERPFRIGDLIKVDELTGTVVTIELRTTALRLPDGRLAIVPNLDVFTKQIVNLNAFELRQFAVSVWVPLEIDLAAVLAAARAELRAVAEIAGEPPPRVQPEATIEGGVTLTCLYWLAHRSCDPDAVAALLVERLAVAVEAVRQGRTPAAPPHPPRPGAEPAARAGEHEAGPEGPRLRLPIHPGLRRRRGGRAGAPDGGAAPPRDADAGPPSPASEGSSPTDAG